MRASRSISSINKQRIFFLVLDGVELLDLAGPAQVFDVAGTLGAPYSLHFCASSPQVRSAQGLSLGQLELLPTIRSSDVVFVAGIALEKLNQPILDENTHHWLLNAHTVGAAIASVCGFDAPRHFRRLWQRHFGVSPSATRKQQTKPPADGSPLPRSIFPEVSTHKIGEMYDSSQRNIRGADAIAALRYEGLCPSASLFHQSFSDCLSQWFSD